jgi:hypothetical protein
LAQSVQLPGALFSFEPNQRRVGSHFVVLSRADLSAFLDGKVSGHSGNFFPGRLQITYARRNLTEGGWL